MSVKVTSLVWESPRAVSGAELLVLLALADWADDFGNCYCKLSKLASKARVSEKTGQRMLNKLADDLVIYFVKRGFGRGAVHELRLYAHRLGQPMAQRISEAIEAGERARRADDPPAEGAQGAAQGSAEGAVAGPAEAGKSDMVSYFSDGESRTSDPESRTFETESRTSDPPYKDKPLSTCINKGRAIAGGRDSPDDPMAALRAAGLSLYGERWCASWLERCRWLGEDEDGRWHVLTPNAFAAARLADQYSFELCGKVERQIRFYSPEDWARVRHGLALKSDIVSGDDGDDQSGERKTA